jgi:hypothetical protein
MKLITERDKIREVPQRWQGMYEDGKYGKDKLDKMIQLNALDAEIATSKQIADIIGNDTWTTMSCSECGKQSIPVIEIGEEPDYESNTVWLCFECIQKLYKLMKGE